MRQFFSDGLLSEIDSLHTVYLPKLKFFLEILWFSRKEKLSFIYWNHFSTPPPLLSVCRVKITCSNGL